MVFTPFTLDELLIQATYHFDTTTFAHLKSAVKLPVILSEMTRRQLEQISKHPNYRRMSRQGILRKFLKLGGKPEAGDYVDFQIRWKVKPENALKIIEFFRRSENAPKMPSRSGIKCSIDRPNKYYTTRFIPHQTMLVIPSILPASHPSHTRIEKL